MRTQNFTTLDSGAGAFRVPSVTLPALLRRAVPMKEPESRPVRSQVPASGGSFSGEPVDAWRTSCSGPWSLLAMPPARGVRHCPKRTLPSGGVKTFALQVLLSGVVYKKRPVGKEAEVLLQHRLVDVPQKTMTILAADESQTHHLRMQPQHEATVVSKTEVERGQTASGICKLSPPTLERTRSDTLQVFATKVMPCRTQKAGRKHGSSCSARGAL
jgi:hypothetical protein